MNFLVNPHLTFNYAGYFISNGSWIHPDKTEKTYELIYVTRGAVHMHDGVIGDVCTEKGHLLVLEPNSRHFGTKSTENVRFYWVHFSLNGVQLPFPERCFSFMEQGQLFRELLHLCNLPQSPDYAVNAVLTHILSELCRISDGGGHFSRRAEEIYEWIRINARADFKVSAAAEHFSVSCDHLTRILKQNYGCGFKELADKFIMSEAKNFLCNTELYIKEIASILGFSDDKAFIGFFKYHEGIYPAEFRNRFSKTHMNIE